MKSTKDLNSITELINNFSTLMKYKFGVSEPPKENNNVTVFAIVSAIAGMALGIAAGLLFAQDTGEKTRKKLAKSFKDAGDKASDYTNKEIQRLNELTKDQISKIKKASKELV